MIIKPLEQYDRELYTKYAREYGTVFNSLDWLSIFGEKVQIYGIFDKGNNLIGGFVTYEEKKIGLSVYRNPPFAPAIGPFLRIDAQNAANITSTWKGAISVMADFIDKLPYSVISFSLNKCVIDTQPYIWKKFKVIPEYTYLLDLTISEESLLKRMSSIRRNDINKGAKDGLIVKQLTDYEVIRSLILKTFSRQDKKINKYYLDKILFEFANDNNSFAFVTYKNNETIACTFSIYDNYTAYYLLGGYDSNNKHHGAGALAVWETIKYAKNLELKYFDFEGSMVPQIEKYFRGFGGQLTPCYRINKAKLPLEMLLKFFKRELF